MRGFVMGLLSGVVLGGLGVHVWSLQAPATAMALPVADLAVPPASCPSAAVPTPTVSPAAPACPPLPTATGPAAQPTPASGISEAAAAALAQPAPVPIPMSAEHAKMLTAQVQQPSLPDLHARLVAESKDPAWAATTEDLIRRDLAAANDTGEFDVPTVECRQTLCEILAFGNGPTSPQKWNRSMSELRTPWQAAGLMNNSSAISGTNGRYVIVTILERRGKP